MPEGLSAQPEAESRKDFTEVGMQEQAERFKHIATLYREDPQVPGSGQYSDFWDNVYKYPDRFKIEGYNSEQVEKTLSQAAHASEIIKESLRFFGAVMRAKRGDTPNLVKSQLGEFEMALSRAPRFSDNKNKQLKVDPLVGVFNWSLVTFKLGGAKIGRIPQNLTDQDIENMTDDLRSILKQVNAFR